MTIGEGDMATREKMSLLEAVVSIRPTVQKLVALSPDRLAVHIDDVVRCILSCATVVSMLPEPSLRMLLAAVSHRDYRHSVLLGAWKTYVEQNICPGVRLFRRAVHNAPDASTRLKIITQYACAAVWNNLDPWEIFAAIKLAEQEVRATNLEMPFRLRLAQIEAVDASRGPSNAFAYAQHVPVADVWEREKLHATKARLLAERALVCPSASAQLLQLARREFDIAGDFHAAAIDADLPPWADVAAPRNDAFRSYVDWKLGIDDDFAPSTDFADPVDQSVSALQGDLMDILEGPPILPCNRDALLFLVLRIVHSNRLLRPELGVLLDRVIAAVTPSACNATIAPGQAIFIALKASLFATAADPTAVILLKNAAHSANDLNARVRILDLLSIALSSTGVLPDASEGVGEYARKLRAELTRVSPFLDDDILWAPLVEQLRRSADHQREN